MGEERKSEGSGLVGSRVRALLGPRVTGQVRYTDDIHLPRMLWGRIVRSPHPHARIKRIDATRALARRGVVAVITGQDMPERFGIIPWTPDEFPLALEHARFVGDAVAAVAATDERTAHEAADLVDVEYELLPAATDLQTAIDRPEIGLGKGGKDNVSKQVDLAFGDVDGQLASSDVVIEGEYYYEGSAHVPIETHCAIANVDANGLLTVWSTTQVPHYLHRELSRVLRVSPTRIRVIQPPVGGAFGGKSEPFSLEFCAAKLAMVTGRPVKFLYTREEEFYAHRGRHPMRMHMKVGAQKDGKLTAVDAHTAIDGGAYSSFGLVTAYYSGQLLTLPAFADAYRFHSTRYFTNKPPCGPKRGHGSVQPRFAFEVSLDKIAHAIDMDPIELRRRNLLPSNTTTVNGMRVTSNGIAECLDRVEAASGWKERRGKLPQGRGLGVATSAYISGTNYAIYPNAMPQSAVQLKVDRSGVVTVFSGQSEIGQGCDLLLAVIVADELGLDLGSVRVVSGDTDLTPVDLGAYSSRGTFMNGNACLHAAQQVRDKLVQAVAEKLEVAPRAILVTRGALVVESDPTRGVPVTEAIQLAEARFGTLGAVGWYNTPKLGGDYRGGTIGASPAYSFTAHVAEVCVDVRTGRVTVDKIWVAHDCGKALVPTIVEGQMEGSAYMGAAEALLEEHVIGPDGLHKGPNLLDYRIPTSLDVPELHALIVESHDAEGPRGAKEAGEGPLHPSIPAIANAIFDAVGVRVDRLPFSPARVLAAIRAQQSRDARRPAAAE
ncbi:xanthine dehydrogenase family protein molybdopterin-binding subunit [Polyangium aurulentum]|uniref:xanthine dehydrogenase family protein molybdopterin-binding subunit n=1 Tax=Polyangium aurulentum TaxID=2567896 RepID=UPI00146BAC23|nr:molybdopterin cofactor-binding domain-containing protein [Polyangium aurulentum]UQA61713.1 molybdopterin-dependent oxidoreductase [Polyangium aurulentum]